MLRGAWDSACSCIASPRKRSDRHEAGGASAAASAAPPAIGGVPRDWAGIKSCEQFEVERAFPCIGTQCAERGGRHPIGSKAQGFRDFSAAHFRKDTEWQHTCARGARACPPRCRRGVTGKTRVAGAQPRAKQSSKWSASGALRRRRRRRSRRLSRRLR